MANHPTSHKSVIDRRLPPSQQGADIRKAWKGEFTINLWDSLAELNETEIELARELRDVVKRGENADIKARSEALAQVSKALHSSREAWYRLILHPTAGKIAKSGKAGHGLNAMEPLDVASLIPSPMESQDSSSAQEQPQGEPIPVEPIQ